jgi:uncharacterized protein
MRRTVTLAHKIVLVLPCHRAKPLLSIRAQEATTMISADRMQSQTTLRTLNFIELEISLDFIEFIEFQTLR